MSERDLDSIIAVVEEEIARLGSYAIAAKYLMDDAGTLGEAAEKLRRYADHLEVLDAVGYELVWPVSDDEGHVGRKVEGKRRGQWGGENNRDRERRK